MDLNRSFEKMESHFYERQLFYIALAFLQLLASSFVLLDMQQTHSRCTRQSKHLLSQHLLERRKTANAVQKRLERVKKANKDLLERNPILKKVLTAT